MRRIPFYETISAILQKQYRIARDKGISRASECAMACADADGEAKRLIRRCKRAKIGNDTIRSIAATELVGGTEHNEH